MRILHGRGAELPKIFAAGMEVLHSRRFFSKAPGQLRAPAALLIVLSTFIAACRTFAPWPTLNLAEPGWTVCQGQAVWRPRRSAPEIAGELLLAQNPDGRSLVQFIKTPFPVLTAQRTAARWQIEFPSEHRVLSGAGAPPARFIWLHLARVLFENAPPPKHWVADRRSRGEDAIPSQAVSPLDKTPGTMLSFRFENNSTGESLEGFLRR